MKRYMKSLLFGFVVPFFAILSLFGVGYSTWYFVNDAINKNSITISTDITGVADFGKIVINYDKDSVEDISSPSLENSKIIVESDGIHLNNPFYVHYLLPKGALISSAGNVLKFNLQLTVDSGYVADRDLAADNIMNVSCLPYSHNNSSLVWGDGRKDVTTPADSPTRRKVIYDGIQWRQDIELVNSKDATKDLYNQFTVSNEGKVETDAQYEVVSPSDSTLREVREDGKTDAKDTFVFCCSDDNLSFKFPEGFRITDNSDEVDVKKNVYLYKDIVQIFSNANISFTFSVSL